MKLKFIEYLKFCVAHDLEFDAVIGDVDMPETFCFYDNMKIKYITTNHQSIVIEAAR